MNIESGEKERREAITRVRKPITITKLLYLKECQAQLIIEEKLKKNSLEIWKEVKEEKQNYKNKIQKITNQNVKIPERFVIIKIIVSEMILEE